ncbi:MAG: hypothetical protein OXC44_07730 [Proteobacteria bacterium]|nr:hypothetical protein [Pseudomonadota bacterium]
MLQTTCTHTKHTLTAILTLMWLLFLASCKPSPAYLTITFDDDSQAPDHAIKQHIEIYRTSFSHKQPKDTLSILTTGILTKDVPAHAVLDFKHDQTLKKTYPYHDNTDHLQLESVSIASMQSESGYKMALKPGTYLLLADCSSRLITLRPKEHQSISLQKVIFETPPLSADAASDSFFIQCERYRNGLFRQSHTNTFTLQVLEGSHKLFINHMPLTIHIKTSPKTSPKTSQTTIYKLAALKAQLATTTTTHHHYFLSTHNHPLNVTQPRTFNTWTYLLEGSYEMTLNGSRKIIDVKAGHTYSIPTALVRFEAAERVNDRRFIAITRTPYHLTFTSSHNTTHPLKVNKTYPLFYLPQQSFTLGFSQKSWPLDLKEHQLTRIPLHTLHITNHCDHKQSTCLGTTDVTLYKNRHKPLIKAPSDVPIPFIASPQSPLWITLSTSHGLKYKLTTKQALTSLQLATVTFKPSIQKHPRNSHTDLIRIETLPANNTNDTAHHHTEATLDLSPHKNTTLQLIAGKYALVSYHSRPDPSSTFRIKYKRKNIFHIKAKQHLLLNGTFYR